MLYLPSILVPVDFSPCSRRALDYALRFAACVKAPVEVLHAYREPDGYVPRIAHPGPATRKSTESHLRRRCRPSPTLLLNTTRASDFPNPSTTADRVQLAVQALELRAHRIVERAHEVFRDAEGLSQSRAGRLKLLASHALDLVGRHTQPRAEQDVKVKGERVYLG